MEIRTANYQLNNTIFRVTYADITTVDADVLVSSDDSQLSMRGGVSKAILNAGGAAIVDDARKHTSLALGDVIVTTAGQLPAKYIFHVVTIDLEPVLQFAAGPTVQAATRRCLRLADALHARHLAFPALATGSAGMLFQVTAEAMTRTIADYVMGSTQIEQVTVALYENQRATASDLNLFYERVVALASMSTQSQKLSTLLAQLRTEIERTQNPDLAQEIASLQAKLTNTRDMLAKTPNTLEHLEQMQQDSNLEAVSQTVVGLSDRAQIETAALQNQQLELEVLNTKLNGLLTQLNIQYANLNKLQIKKAKYGPLEVPLHLENAIEELQETIENTETLVKETRGQLAQLTAQN